MSHHWPSTFMTSRSYADRWNQTAQIFMAPFTSTENHLRIFLMAGELVWDNAFDTEEYLSIGSTRSGHFQSSKLTWGSSISAVQWPLPMLEPYKSRLGTDTATGAVRIWQEAANTCGTPIQQKISNPPSPAPQHAASAVPSLLYFLYRNDSILLLRDSKSHISFYYFEQLFLDIPGTTVPSLLFIQAMCAFEINVSSRSRRWDFRTSFHYHIQIYRSIQQPQRDFWLSALIIPCIPWQEKVRFCQLWMLNT